MNVVKEKRFLNRKIVTKKVKSIYNKIGTKEI